MSDYSNVESLVIEIETDSADAAAELDILTQKVVSFKRAVNYSSGMKTFSQNFASFTQSLADIPSVSVSNVTSIASLMRELGNLSNIKLSSTISHRLSEMVEIAASSDIAKIESLTSSIVSLRALDNIKISPSIGNQLQRIAELSKDLEGADFAKLKELVDAIIPLNQLAVISSDNVSKLGSAVKKYSDATRTASTRTKTFNTVLANIRVRFVMIAHAVRSVARVLTTGIETYGDYIETLNLFSVSMGEAGESAYEFAKQCQDLLGIDLTQWMKSQGVFMSLAKGFGIAEDRAALMSKNLTQLGYDISSFYNISVEDSMEKLQSAFSGQLRPVRSLGYDLSQAKLEAIALSYGIDETVSSMTQAEKSQLRYIALLTQVTHVQGDLARTLDSPINQLRILQAQLQQLYRSLGLVFIPLLNKILPYLNAILRVIKMILDEIAALFGMTLPEVNWNGGINSASNSAANLTDELEEAGGAAKELKNTLASFDEINLITSTSGGKGSGVGDTGTGSAWDFPLPDYDFLGNAIENRAKGIADSMMDFIRPALEVLKDLISWIRDNTDVVLVAFKAIATSLLAKKAISWLKNITSELKGINKEVLGISLLVGGITISYAGGKSLANGEWLKGALETVLGLGLSAVGGKLLFGAMLGSGVGVAIGLSIGIIATLAGFAIQADENWKADIDAAFYATDKGKQSMDDFVASWKDFTSSITGNSDAVITAFSKMSESKDSIQSILSQMNALDEAYDSGLISASEYAEQMKSLFADLSEAVVGYLRGAKDVIETELSGALGTFLMNAGFTVTEIRNLMAESEGNIAEKIKNTQTNMRILDSLFERNLISSEEYRKGMEENRAALAEFANVSDVTSESVQQFQDAIKNGVNLENLDTALAGIKSISAEYDTALSKLEEERKSAEEAFESYGAGLTGESKKRWDELLIQVTNYFDDQEQKLKTGYASALEALENETVDRWETVFDTKGLHAAIRMINDDVSEIGNAINAEYDKLGMSDKRSSIIDDIKQIEQEYENAKKFATETGEPVVDAVRNIFEMFDISGIEELTEETFNNYIQKLKEAREESENSAKAMSHDINDVMKDIKSVFSNLANGEDGEKKIAEFILALKSKYPDFEKQIDSFTNLLEKAFNIDVSDDMQEMIDSIVTYSVDFKTAGYDLGESTYNGYTDRFNAKTLSADLDEAVKNITNSASNLTTSVATKLSQDKGKVTKSVGEWISDINDKLKKGDLSNSTSVLIGTVSGVFENTDMSEYVTNWIGEMSDVFKNDSTVSGSATDFQGKIKDALNNNLGIFKDVGNGIRNSILDYAAGNKEYNAYGKNVIDQIDKGITDNVDDLKLPSEKISSTIKTSLEGTLNVMKTLGINVVKNVGEGLGDSNERNTAVSKAKSFANDIKQAFDDMDRDIIHGVRDLLDDISRLISQFEVHGNITIQHGNWSGEIPGYAAGGYPRSADLFYANENGVPEYVGSIGGRTAVANNTSIVDGVSEGVYKAIRDTGIAQNVKKLTDKDNKVVFAPSAEAGKVMSISTNMYKGSGGRY